MRKCFWCSAVLLWFSLLVSITAHPQLQKIYLHPKASGSEKQSAVVDSIRFVPLEIRDGVDLSRFNYVTVTGHHFLIIDYPEKTILLYSKKGDFIKKINYKKWGEGLSPAYQEHSNELVFFGENKNYSLTPKDRIRIMLDWNNPRNKKYFKKYRIDLNDTAFAVERVDPTENDILHARHYFADHYWRGRVTTSQLYKDSLDYELKIYRNHEFIKGFFPYNRINEPRFLFTEENVVVGNTDIPDVHLVTRPFYDTIYKMINDSLLPAYQLVLPLENSLPPSFFKQAFKNKPERENFRRNNGWMLHQVDDFYETPRFIYFAVRYLSNFETYLYRKQTHTTYKTKNIRPDSSQYNLPLLADAGLLRNGNRFYKLQKAGDFLRFFEQHKTAPVPKELENFLGSQPNRAAPVIVEFKLKD